MKKPAYAKEILSLNLDSNHKNLVIHRANPKEQTQTKMLKGTGRK